MNEKKRTEIYIIQEKIERSFEIFQYYVIFFILLFSYILIPDEINVELLNITAATAFVLAVLAYRVLPQQQGGRFSYSFRQKNILIIAADILLVTILLAATGGSQSPFVIIYMFPVMALVAFGTTKYIYWFIPYFLVLYWLINIVIFKTQELFDAAFIAIIIYFIFAIFLVSILIRYREFMWNLTGSKRSRGSSGRKKKK